MNELDKKDHKDKFSDYYLYISTLGSGSFGKVVHAIDRLTGEEVAVKVIEKKTVKQGRIAELKREAEILSSLDHPNIVKFVHLKETEKRIFIVMELILGGNLQQFLVKNKLTDSQAANVMRGVLNAVSYLHKNNIIHRDIKPDNILLTSPHDLSQIKLADFGLSAQFDQSVKHQMEDLHCGTLSYMAPEQTAKRSYSKSVDIWSCGILMYTLITSKHPLIRLNETSESFQLQLQHPKWTFPIDFSDLGKNLFLKLVEIVPLERYTASQALSHPWISRMDTRAPLTTFEKFKIYGEHLQLKGIIFPVFFACVAAESNLVYVVKKVEELEKRPPLPSPVKVKGLAERNRLLATPTPDSSLVKRRSRLISPNNSEKISRKLTPKEIIRKKSGGKLLSFDKSSK